MVEIEHRRKAEIDAAGPKLGAEHVAGGARCLEGVHGAGTGAAVAVAHPQLAQEPHWRQMGEAVAAKTLDATALVIDADQHVGSHRLDLGRELDELAPALPVAPEQDEATGQGVLQAAAVVGIERQAGDVEDDRGVAVDHRNSCCSTTTKLAA